MGAISLEKENRLYWLGRYIERIFTTLEKFYSVYDSMLDSSEVEKLYPRFCQALSIPNIYSSGENFIRSYLFSKENPDSLVSNMDYAYGNGIVLRETVGTEALSFIHMAMATLSASENSDSVLFSLQPIRDDIYAFWGCIDDSVGEEDCRNIMKLGRRMERLDLYIRFKNEQEDLERELSKLIHRLQKVEIPYDEERLEDLVKYVLHGIPERGEYKEAVLCLENLFAV